MKKTDSRPYTVEHADLFQVESEIMERRYDVSVAVPASYQGGEHRYGVLVVLDANLSFATATETARLLALGQEIEELIVVGIGSPREEGLQAFAHRRMYEFSPTPYWRAEGPFGDYNRKVWAMYGYDMTSGQGLGGAAKFLQFLTGELLPLLAQEYRTDPERLGLYGDSSGGAFVLYAMFSGASPFSRYICGSPAAATCNDELYRMEERYAATHRDLAAKVFLAAGMEEMSSPGHEGGGIASGVARFSGLLALRAYPTLRVVSMFFDHESHVSVIPAILSRGLRVVCESPAKQ